MKAYYKYKNKVTDDLEDAYEIIRNVGRFHMHLHMKSFVMSEDLFKKTKRICIP